jgi:RNA polymerase sigma factor (sigma-70 family)
MEMSGHGLAPRDIGALFSVGTTGGMTDAELLERFVDRDREASRLAFAELVARHSPMVLRVCQTILHDAHDAEDAFQATFLVLARRAESIRKRASAASWLYGVARRVAMCARLSRSRQRIHERKAAELTRSSADATGWDDQFEVLHDEIARLSERYRVVIVLCDLEGLTEGQTAMRLGLPVGTVRSRLRRGRERLRGRLLSRGVTLSTLVFGSTSVSDGAPVVVSTALASSATRVASFYAAGATPTSGAVPTTIMTLTETVLSAMVLSKLTVFVAALLAIGCASLLATGTVRFSQEEPIAKPLRPSPTAKATASPAPAQSADIFAKLEEPIPMEFLDPTPLSDVLKYVKQATVAPGYSGIPINVDPVGLQVAECSLKSPVTIDAKNTPLKVTLTQLLSQLRLEYVVQDGASILISSNGRIAEKLKDSKRFVKP